MPALWPTRSICFSVAAKCPAAPATSSSARFNRWLLTTSCSEFAWLFTSPQPARKEPSNDENQAVSSPISSPGQLRRGWFVGHSQHADQFAPGQLRFRPERTLG